MLGQKGRGDTLGEMAVLTGGTRSATVRALRDTVLARLPRERADTFLRRHPEALLALTRMLASWLDHVPDKPPAGCLAVAIATAGPSVDGAGFAASLARRLAAIGPTLHVDARFVDERLGPGAAECADGTAIHSELSAWLSEQEAAHKVVLYEADPGRSPWTRRCLRQADHILVVADAAASPSLGLLAGELAALEEEQGRQLELLVLLQAADAARPRGTGAWLALRPFHRHHHLRRGRDADLDSLARFLAGRAVGLVLGGGGAKGFAHIGVIRALEEAGIPIDRIGGTSMGGVIAAQYALGRDWREALELSRRGWLEIAPQKVYTLPIISVLSMRKGQKMLDMWYGDACIEDLWLPYFCVSTNISRTELVVHRRGPLVDAVAASMTIPGVTPPVVTTGGDLLVDGGVLNNLPTDVMRMEGPGPIIASDVSAVFDVRAHPSYERTPTPWQLVRQSFAPRAQRRPFPNILRLVHRAALLASDVYAKQAKREVELFLDLPMDGFDMFDMTPLDRIAEFGYEFTRKQLAEDAVRAAILGVPTAAGGS